ncbi:MAG: Gfo/Idh/MocA family oxidoreductase [Pirellulales bacterium]|nr:Gfo/Idh/MocA family oxidoreductase [Pirellulales bacterium]
MKDRGKKNITRFNRRRFLGNSALAAAGACLTPYIVPSSVFGKEAPGNRINVGMIGMGNQSTIDLPMFLQQDDVQMVAVCDVNTASHGYANPKQFRGRKPGQEEVNAFYAKKTGADKYKGCDAYIDFREIIGRDDIDAVAIVAPDHWHALMTIAAAEAGKDIYCEKPMSLTVRQGQKMVEAVRRHKRVLQTGSQWRSHPDAGRVCALIRNGRIGQVKRVITDVAENNFAGPGPGWKPMPVPEGFDYDFWLGPAPKAPYHEDRCFYRFRFILDYSGGQTTNFGCHSNGLVQWALGEDHGGPIEFEDNGSAWPLPGDLFTTPTKVDFIARYASGVELHCRTSKRGFGARFEGSEGWLDFDYGGFRSSPESLKDATLGPGDKPLYADFPPSPRRKTSRLMNHLHVRNFIDCIKSRKDPVEPVEAGHRTAALCHLGNIAMKLGRKIRWDPRREQVIDDPEAAAMLDRPMRAPWSI